MFRSIRNHGESRIERSSVKNQRRSLTRTSSDLLFPASSAGPLSHGPPAATKKNDDDQHHQPSSLRRLSLNQPEPAIAPFCWSSPTHRRSLHGRGHYHAIIVMSRRSRIHREHVRPRQDCQQISIKSLSNHTRINSRVNSVHWICWRGSEVSIFNDNIETNLIIFTS